MISANEKLTSCRYTRRIGIISALLLILFFRSPSFAQQPRLATGNWTRGLSGAWGHSWTPGYGKTKTDIQFVAFHPQLGRFVTDHLELYGEGSLFLYYEPTITVSGGVAAVGGRYHFWNDRGWTPYVMGIAGLIWNPLNIPELDRVFNFQMSRVCVHATNSGSYLFLCCAKVYGITHRFTHFVFAVSAR